MIRIEECVRKERKSLHGYLRNSAGRILLRVLKEKVLVEEEDLQDYQRRRKEYHNQAVEIKRIGRVTKTTVITIVIGALGTISKSARPSMGG